MKASWLFRADAGSVIGLGHFRRIMTLSSAFEGELHLILKTNLSGLADEAREKFNQVHLISDDFSFEDEILLLNKIGKTKGCIVDISHSLNISKLENTQKTLEAYKAIGSLAVIDGFSDDSLRQYMSLDCNFLITPYIGVQKSEGTYTHLNGSEFFIQDPRFNYAGFKVRPEISNILITMGGADPYGLSSQLLKLLPADGFRMTWRIIIGPAFSNEQQVFIEEFAQKHDWLQTIHSPENISPIYSASDLVFVGEGLSKYELSTLGVPMVLTSCTNAGDQANKAFSNKIGCVNLGRIEHITDATMKTVFGSSELNYESRLKLSKACRHLVDGQGAERIKRSLS